MFDITRIVGIFHDDEHPETHGVGILNEDGNDLLLQESDPVVIVEMANRLMMFADEIMANETKAFGEVLDMFNEYPEGTTLGEILADKEKKTLGPVED